MPHTIQISEFNSHDVITQVNNQLITTSKLVAETFGKLHKDILKKIKNLDCSNEFASANFCAHVENTKAGAVNRDSKFYNITKDGFMFLVMGFTGKKAARIKEAYINAFNDMEATLFQPAPKETLLLTFKQQRHIQSIVGTLAYEHEKGVGSIYRDIYKKFDVTSYTHIPKDLYPDVCAYLNAGPKWELMDRVEPVQLEFKKSVQCDDFVKRQTSWHYLTLDDMMDYGWHLQLNKLIGFIKKHKDEDIRFGDIEGLKQEIDSLCSLVERQSRKLDDVKRIVS